MAEQKKSRRRAATSSENVENKSTLEIRKPSTDVLVKELNGALQNLEASLQEIEDGRVVSQDVLNLEFRI